jgi:hypothetical protein
MQATYATDVRIVTARVAAPRRESAIAATKALQSENRPLWIICMRTCHSKDLLALMSEPERIQQDKIRTMNRPAIARTCGRAGLPELNGFLAHNSSVFGAK